MMVKSAEQCQEAFDELPTLADAYAGPDSSYYDDESLLSWRIVMTHNRDSDNLEESNWDALLDLLGGEEEGRVYIQRAGHWAVGWVEYMIVNPKASDKVMIAGQALLSLEDYPVLDEDDYSQREWEDEERERQEEEEAYRSEHSYEDEDGDYLSVAEDVTQAKADITEFILKKCEDYPEKVDSFLTTEYAEDMWEMLEQPEISLVMIASTIAAAVANKRAEWEQKSGQKEFAW